jgi:hypothetical protein
MSDPDSDTDAEWQSLTDGTLAGWETVGDADAWRPTDRGVVCAGGDGGYLYTEREYDDFELELEFRLTEGANSGVFVWLSNPQDPVNTGLELQLLDTPDVEEPGTHDCGALYDMVPPSSMPLSPAGEWNEFRVVCEGSRLTEALNGVEVVDADLDRWDTAGENPDGSANKFEYAWAELPHEGHVALQDHGDEVAFRDLRLRER